VQENPIDFPTPPGLIAGQETRFIGRERELDFLEQALQPVIDGRLPQWVTITAEPGVGATRLLYEFERRLKLLPERFTLLRNQIYSSTQDSTLSFWRDLVFRTSGLRLQDSPGVMHEKLARTIGGKSRLSQAAPDKEAYRLADRLLKVWTNDDKVTTPQPMIVEALAQFLQAISEGTTLVAVLEHLHQADDSSLDILETLVEQYADLPLLILCTTQPDFLDRRPAWREQPSDPFAPYHHLDLQPLSAIDGRHMLSEIFQRLPSPPLRLIDLIATAAQGNPLFIEETVKLLLNQSTITNDPSGRWRVDMAEVEAMRLPTSLDELFNAQLKQLSLTEQQLLSAAAVMGSVFWDAALWQDTLEATLSPEVVDAALLNLEQKRLITPNQMWSFADTQAYTFVHPLFCDVAYHDLSATGQRANHRQVAHWLSREQQNGRMGSGFPAATLIDYHLGQQ